jgi:hypothetical protein
MSSEAGMYFCKLCQRATTHIREGFGITCVVCAWATVGGVEEFSPLERRRLTFLRWLYGRGALTEWPDEGEGAPERHGGIAYA